MKCGIASNEVERIWIATNPTNHKIGGVWLSWTMILRDVKTFMMYTCICEIGKR